MPFDSTLDPTTEVILGAIDYLERCGWTKGAAIVGSQRCIWGALREAAMPNCRFVGAASDRIKRANGITVDLPFWNDAQERTKEQVLEALRNSLITA